MRYERKKLWKKKNEERIEGTDEGTNAPQDICSSVEENTRKCQQEKT